ncbi:ABC transporter permease [Enemella sp. A6]|uniref:ABC transporter permease n=1 Tax=Enemella sp. A6 TaxID=3440152 RepID=UPI003EB85ED2
MTTTISTATTAGPLTPAFNGGLRGALADGWTITWRNLQRLRRSPDMILFAVLQPIMFVLLFSQVYGGSIHVAGTDYTDYMMAGIFGQTVVFGSTFSGSAMAQDLKEGIIDRFRTLPMSPAGVLIGRTNADLVLNSISMVIMMLTGFLVGWRFHNGVPSLLAGVGLLLMFSYAFSWVMSLLGMMVRTPETINNAAFMVLFPLTFISNAFVQPQNMPKVLEVVANWNPVSALVHAARTLFGNIGSAPTPDTLPLQHSIVTVLVGSVVMLVIFVPLCVARFQNTSSR